jgi:hypothetical protein
MIKKLLRLEIFFLLTCFLIALLCFVVIQIFFFKGIHLEEIRTKVFGQYNIVVGTPAFATFECVKEYKETEDRITYIDLCSELENIIFKTQVVRIEKGECSCYKTEYKQ